MKTFKIKHTQASSKDTKATIQSSELLKVFPTLLDYVTLRYIDTNETITYKASRCGKTYYALNKFKNKEMLPSISCPKYYTVVGVETYLDSNLFDKKEDHIFNNEFDHIRNWALERGIYEKGDKKTQFIKLVEEVGELSQSILKEDKELFVDSIGDCVIVLTNLAKLCDINIEDCINSAYNEIRDRKGKMDNGTFKKS